MMKLLLHLPSRTRRESLTVALAFSAFALVSCSGTGPTQPEAVSGESPVAPSFALAANSWTARPPIPQGRSSHVAAVVNNAAAQPVLYLIGGQSVRDEGVPVEAFNYVTNTWQTKNAGGTGIESNGVGVIGGRLYISGGLTEHGDGLEAENTLVAYDPVSDAFTLKAFMPRRTYGGVTGVIGSKLYVLIGGCSDCTHRIDHRLYRYDPATNAWTTSLSWAPHTHAYGAGGVINGKFYVAGGLDAAGAANRTLDVYDPSTNKWKTLAALPTAVSGAAGAVIQNKLYVIGGNGGGRSVFAYNPVTNTWQTKAPLLTGRYLLAAASLVTPSGNPKILAAGGRGSEDRGFTANELYTP